MDNTRVGVMVLNILLLNVKQSQIGPEVIKLFSCSTELHEHKIYPAHKCQNANNNCYFSMF